MLLDNESHRQLKEYVKDLNHFYKEHPMLWQVDYSWEGFQWIVPDDNQQSVIAFLRRDAKGKMVLVVCNFNPVERTDYQMGVPHAGTYKELLNSDDVKYGGSGVQNPARRTRKKPMHGFEQSISLTLPPMSTVYLSVPQPRASKGKTSTQETTKTKKTTTASKTKKQDAKSAKKPAARKKAAAKTE